MNKIRSLIIKKKISYGPSMNSTLTKSQKKSVNSSVIPFNNFTLDEQL